MPTYIHTHAYITQQGGEHHVIIRAHMFFWMASKYWCVCMCVGGWLGGCACACVCVWERECVCVCVCVCYLLAHIFQATQKRGERELAFESLHILRLKLLNVTDLAKTWSHMTTVSRIEKKRNNLNSILSRSSCYYSDSWPQVRALPTTRFDLLAPPALSAT